MNNRLMRRIAAVGSLLLMAVSLGGCIFVPYRPYHPYYAYRPAPVYYR